ncbi:MAG: Ada metal-binding domain-containing protein [Patescibacteria group bacterium]
MEKIKQFVDSEQGKDVLIVIILILVGLGSFELGRLSNQSNSSGIKIEYGDELKNQPANVISATNNPNSSGKNFFASNRGTKYYSIGCSAGKTIKQENRIYFATGEEAQKAGYELSSSCQ